MEDYPRDLAEFEARFATEEACRDYLYQMHWPDGFRCPNCGHGQAWPVRKVFECARCARQTSVTAGTIFQDSRQPLRLWFRAMWWRTTQKNGASALGLQRVLGLRRRPGIGCTSSVAPWRPARDRLTGPVEVDETLLGGLEEGVRGRPTESNVLLEVAAQENGAGIGRVRMRSIPNASARSLMVFVQDSIEACRWRGILI